ncbi:MAG: nodulation protein NfeD, partial [Candidatus Latescibacteria bacterium]|nr:nodulation protein NfeD [Candidatus Latescibacterota bacterium]
PITSSYVIRLLEAGLERGAEAILLELDTPGGLDMAMRDIIKDFLASEVTVIVYVHPSGARAGSAGVFITMAAHIAAMTPGTNIGAAHPVAIGGEMDSIMVEKVTHDAAAYARSIAKIRNRNEEWAEEAVRRSVSATAEEAVTDNIVDVNVESVEELLEVIHGRTVDLPAGEHQLNTAGARIEPMPVNLREKLLGMLADPNIAYIFMLLGIYGLIFELQNPGAILPGVVGVICLLLAFMSFQTLPLNVTGLALILLAIVLFILEIKVPSYGILTIGGIISMLLGSLMLFDTVDPAMRVSLGIIITAVIVTALFFGFAIGMGIRAQSRRVTTGHEGLVGEAGEAHTTLDPTGTIAIHGEFWKAESATGEPIEAGTRVEVIEVAGLQLLVRPAERSPFSKHGDQGQATA